MIKAFSKRINERLFIKKRIKQFFLALVACLAILANGNVCYAQYYGSGLNYLYYGSYLFYPLNSLFYPLMYGSMYRNMYGNPNKSGNQNNNGSNNGLNYATNNSSNYATNYGGYNAPSYSGSNYPNNGALTNYNNGAPNTTYPSNQYNQQYGTGIPFNSQSDIFSSSNPPLASNRSLAYTAQGMSGAPAQAASIDGFFKTVSTSYKGDLVRALNKPDMHSWAESINLINRQQPLPSLNKQRQSEISNILKDQSLDPQKKLDLVHLLIQ